MKTLLFAIVFSFLSGVPAYAGTITKTVIYNVDEKIFKKVMVYDNTSKNMMVV